MEVFPREGVGLEKFFPSLEGLFFFGFRGEGTWNVPGILPGCPGPESALGVSNGQNDGR